jgi:hypothetical protein
MTTGRINQVATVAGRRPTAAGRLRFRGGRRSVGPPALSSSSSSSPPPSPQSPSHSRSSSAERSVCTARVVSRTRATVLFAPSTGSERPPETRSPFLSPSERPLRGRNTQDRQARTEPKRVAQRSNLDRTDIGTTTETLAGPTARRPRSQPGVYEVASRTVERRIGRRRR